jgi:hypothetical protein
MIAKLKVADALTATAGLLLLVGSLLPQFGAPFTAYNELVINVLVGTYLLGLLAAAVSVAASLGVLPARLPWQSWAAGAAAAVLLNAIFGALALSYLAAHFLRPGIGLGAGVYLGIAAAVLLFVSVGLRPVIPLLHQRVPGLPGGTAAEGSSPRHSPAPQQPSPPVPTRSEPTPPVRIPPVQIAPVPPPAGPTPQVPAPPAPGAPAPTAGASRRPDPTGGFPGPPRPGPIAPRPPIPDPTGEFRGPPPPEPAATTRIAASPATTAGFSAPPAPEATTPLAAVPVPGPTTGPAAPVAPRPAGRVPSPPVAFSPFWAAVPTARPLYRLDDPSVVVGILQPGTWYAAVGPHSHGLIVALPTGETGVLVQVADLFRG